ncbi:MAG: flagellar motor protein MotB, partial [bacterium]
MIGGRIVVKRGAKDEAEKPFWISYADLMTALMMLFLVTMSVALLAVTKTVSEAERLKAEREHD